jgi:hypothetical protein
MAIDPERVGLQNIEVPQVCNFGDNELWYVDVLNDCSNLMIIYDDDKEEEDDDDDADDDDSDVSIVSTSQCWSFISLSVSHYHAGLVTKFIYPSLNVFK